MTNTTTRGRVFKVAKVVYLGMAVLVGGINVLSAMDSKRAMQLRCVDRNASMPTFPNALFVQPALMGLGWPVSIFLPLVRPYDSDCR